MVQWIVNLNSAPDFNVDTSWYLGILIIIPNYHESVGISAFTVVHVGDERDGARWSETKRRCTRSWLLNDTFPLELGLTYSMRPAFFSVFL